MSRNKRNLSIKNILDRLATLFKQPMFWFMTLLGNGLVFLGSGFFYFVEHEKNPGAQSFLDCIAWAVGTVTTIGYGDITPQTTVGKILGIFLMMGGTLFLWSYMALLVSALITPDLSFLEKEIKELDEDLSKIRAGTLTDEQTLEQLSKKIDSLQESVTRIEGKIGAK